MKIQFIETSAKTSQNVDMCFEIITVQIRARWTEKDHFNPGLPRHRQSNSLSCC